MKPWESYRMDELMTLMKDVKAPWRLYVRFSFRFILHLDKRFGIKSKYTREELQTYEKNRLLLRII